MAAGPFRLAQGRPFPDGASVAAGGVNFAVFSRHATAVTLVLYASATAREPLQVIDLDPVENRTFFFWHVLVEDAGAGLWYAWRMDGPADTARSGLRFDPRRELLDPWARAVGTGLWDRRRASSPLPQPGTGLRARVIDDEPYDWEGDRRLERRPEDSIIYELHVGGFTRHPSSGVAAPGSFAGLVEKIPYLQALGITDVELMPVMAFDEQDVPPGTAALGLGNYWGYSPYGFFAPHPAYCAGPDGRREFRDMVKALHRAGIGVILDVVFNHTAEGGGDGPVISFKGLANESFYHLDPADRRRYRDFTGTGNTLNCNHPLVARYILHCLEYWVREMHVDGFRFDLASVMARGEDGRPVYHAPVLWSIEFSEALLHTRLIAEAWDASGLYQVGSFPGYRWAEWNGRYRDSVRRFVRGDGGLLGEIASRIAGSSDLYAPGGRLPINSINFVTCHDGFTLHDLVSYDRRHNEANGEANRDGAADNHSWNCGIEGPSDDPAVLSLRRRLARNHLAILMLSQGQPMLLAGDEVLRSQQGNNNAYCQDNEISWLDWSLVERNGDFLRYVRELIALRRRHPSLRRARFLTGQPDNGHGGLPDIRWQGADGGEPAWHAPDAGFLGFTLAGREAAEPVLQVMLNMTDAPCRASIPQLGGRQWRRTLDTSLPAPQEILRPGAQPAIEGSTYSVAPRSVVVLEAWSAGEPSLTSRMPASGGSVSSSDCG
ncbi:MAG: glycogen debranching protein GlgX [Gammaproteobacteria bacterium]|nr:glycogen debranching protein GlgX [Gammaproteobacteria bacterium]